MPTNQVSQCVCGSHSLPVLVFPEWDNNAPYICWYKCPDCKETGHAGSDKSKSSLYNLEALDGWNERQEELRNE